MKARLSDIDVPADAEFVIEGYVDPGGAARVEGPFGDHTGYYSLPRRLSRLPLSSASRAGRTPIYPATIVGIPPKEDCWMAKATERLFLPLLKRHLPEIVDLDHAHRGRLPQLRDRVDQEALSRPGAQGHELHLGHGPDDVHEAHRRRGRRREPARPLAWWPGAPSTTSTPAATSCSPRGPSTPWTTPRRGPATATRLGVDATRKLPEETGPQALAGGYPRIRGNRRPRRAALEGIWDRLRGGRTFPSWAASRPTRACS